MALRARQQYDACAGRSAPAPRRGPGLAPSPESYSRSECERALGARWPHLGGNMWTSTEKVDFFAFFPTRSVEVRRLVCQLKSLSPEPLYGPVPACKADSDDDGDRVAALFPACWLDWSDPQPLSRARGERNSCRDLIYFMVKQGDVKSGPFGHEPFGLVVSVWRECRIPAPGPTGPPV